MQIDVCKILMGTCNSNKPSNISELLLMLKPAAAGFPDLRLLLQLALTVPVANVAAERSFSCMRRIRTYIRSTMKEDRLSGLANLSMGKSSNIDYDDLVTVFSKLPSLRDSGGISALACQNVRRITLT